MPASSPASRRPSSTPLVADSLMHLTALGIGGFTPADLSSSGAYVSKHDLTSSQHALIQGSVRGMLRRAWREFDAERLPIDAAIKAVVAGGCALTVYAIMYRMAMMGQVVSVVASVVVGVLVVGGLVVQEGHTGREHEKALELEESVHGTRLGHGAGGRGLSLNALNDLQSTRNVAAMTGGGRGGETASHASFHHAHHSHSHSPASAGTGSSWDRPLATAPTSLNPSPRASVQHPALLGAAHDDLGARAGGTRPADHHHLGLPPLLSPNSGSSLGPSLLSVGSSAEYAHSHSSGLTGEVGASSVGLSIPTSINSAVSPRSSASIVPSLPDVTPSSAPGTGPRKHTTNRRGLGVLSPMVPTVMSTISSISIHSPDPSALNSTHPPAASLDSQPLAAAATPSAAAAPELRAAASSLVAEPGDVAIPSTSTMAIVFGSTTASALMVASTPPESSSSGNVFSRVAGEQDGGLSASAVQTYAPAPSQVSMAASSTASTSQASVSGGGAPSSGGASKVTSSKASGAVGGSSRLDEFHSVASVGQAGDGTASENDVKSGHESEVESESLASAPNMVPASSLRASTSTTFSSIGAPMTSGSNVPLLSTPSGGGPSSFRPTGLIAISPALALRLPTFLSPIASSGVSAEAMTISDNELGPAMRVAANILPSSRRFSGLREDEQEHESAMQPEPAMMIPVGQHLSMSRRPNMASQQSGGGAGKGERRASFSGLGVAEELEKGETPSLDRSGAAAAAAAAVANVAAKAARAEGQQDGNGTETARNVPPGIYAARQRQKQALGLVEAPPTAGLALGPGLRPASESESVMQMRRFASEVAARLQRVAVQAGGAGEDNKGKQQVEGQSESESAAASPSDASVGESLERSAATAVVVGGAQDSERVAGQMVVVGMPDRKEEADAMGFKPVRVNEQSMLLQVLGNQPRQLSSVSIVVHDEEGDINVVRDGAAGLGNQSSDDTDRLDGFRIGEEEDQVAGGSHGKI